MQTEVHLPHVRAATRDCEQYTWNTNPGQAAVNHGPPSVWNTEQTSEAVEAAKLKWSNALQTTQSSAYLAANIQWAATESGIPSSILGPASHSHPDLGLVNLNSEPKRPPRPPNAWILYRSDCIQHERATRPAGAPKPTQADLSKQFGGQWRKEPEAVKAEYERMAEAAREEHAQKYPGTYRLTFSDTRF